MSKPAKPSHFIQEIIDEDMRTNRYGGRVHTRFPPEPNGYLHIGHVKAICLDFDTAAVNGGRCNLRFDDTNPVKEEEEYVQSIIEDVRWLGYDWGDRLYYASDYFEQMYEYALMLIKKGLAFVCDLAPEEIREYRGTLTTPGRDSPYRERSVEENLDLFQRMRAGEFPDGSRVLRAKIDMASPNMNMRDPVIYRILHANHHRTGDEWCIYPMYDYAHPVSDALEGITHSLCTLEFEDHRPLYDWFLEKLEFPSPPQQIEFARLNVSHTITSKRKLRRLIESGYVEGWDDPRMPTIRGMRRRGYTPEALKEFCNRVGVAKNNSTIDYALLEQCVREDLNKRAQRVMAVLKPLKVVITNYPEGRIEELETENNPEDPDAGTRRIPFSRVIYIERDDFMEDPPRKFHRLSPGREVRLKSAYIIRCEEAIKDPATGEIIELHCTYDPQTRSGSDTGGRKVRSTIHWVSAAHALEAVVRLYRPLFLTRDPEEGGDSLANLNPDSLEVLTGCLVEPSLAKVGPGDRFQFLRQGYFCLDSHDQKGKLRFNQIVPLRDTWAKLKERTDKK
ncbi:MAG: glutamine--tRNA ligase/YqeY domain fusion protein [Limnochordia bacterium]|jgi:glutaminyl-tRNA synthetase